MIEAPRRLLPRHPYMRYALLLGLTLCACALMTHTLNALTSPKLVLKLHSSEERFIEEALHEIVLVPEKLAPSKPEEPSLEDQCKDLVKRTCLECEAKGAREAETKQKAAASRDKDAVLEEERAERRRAEDDEEERDRDGEAGEDSLPSDDAQGRGAEGGGSQGGGSLGRKKVKQMEKSGKGGEGGGGVEENVGRPKEIKERGHGESVGRGAGGIGRREGQGGGGGVSSQEKDSKRTQKEVKEMGHRDENPGGGGGGGRGERESQQRGGSGRKKEVKEVGHVEVLMQEVWAARRRAWHEDREMQRVRRLLAVNTQYRRNVDLMNVNIPRLAKFKNPCFFSNPHETTHCRSGAFKVWAQFSEGRNQGTPDKRQHRLSCLPYFIIAGMPQCGATDLLNVLGRHPDVKVPIPLQSKWLESARFEESCSSVNTYLDYYRHTSQLINTSTAVNGFHRLVAGEVAEDILWDNHVWPVLPGNERQLEPRYTNADYLHHLDPDVKVIIIVRDPTERLYAEYFKDSVKLDFKPSAEDFNTRVMKRLDVLRTCLRSEPMRTCVYDGVQEAANKAVRIRVGMYHVMLQDWLRVFPRDQVHVINYETFYKDTKTELSKLIKFLKITRLTETEINKMLSPARDTKKNRDSQADEMMGETREMLDNFYRPQNKFLATLLEDETFLWGE